MALDPRIILAGSNPDLMASFDQGQQAGERSSQIGQPNALRSLYQTQGAGIASGDQGALNALAAIDPMASLGVQGQRQTMQATQQRMDMLTREEQRQIQSQAASLSAAERAAEAQRIEQGVAMGLSATSPQQWDQIMQQNAPDLVGQFNNREMLANRFMSIADILKRQDEGTAGQQYRPATQDEAAQYGAQSGQINTKTGQFTAINPPRNMSIEVGPDGRTRIIEGPGAGQNERTDGPADPSSALAMINSIDGILNDPALENATGVLAWTQAIPGTPMHRFGQRTKQLEGQAFLQAFESLKGGGQITEIEGTKATQAMGRLATTQDAKDYRDALTELRSILATAAARPEGWVETQRAIIAGQDPIPAEIVVSMSPEQIMGLGPAGLRRLPLGQLKGLSDEQWDALEALGSGQ